MTAPYKRIHVVINPASGKDEPILNVLNDVFHQYDVYWEASITKQYGDATRFARQAAEAGFDLVAGYGGDGTQHEVANGILGTKAVMGVLPGGLSSPDDGLVDIFVLDSKNLETLRAATNRVLHLHTNRAENFFWRGKEVTIETDPDQPVWTDGEYAGRTPITAKVVPGAITVAAPEKKE